MNTLHPMVVHFPIALAVLWPIADALGLILKRPELSQLGLGILALAALFTIAAVVTGQAAFDTAVELGADAKILNTHADNANLVPWAMLLLLFVRTAGVLKLKRSGHVLAVVLGVALWPFVYVVGESGGALVFEQGIGVKVDARRAPR